MYVCGRTNFMPIQWLEVTSFTTGAWFNPPSLGVRAEGGRLIQMLQITPDKCFRSADLNGGNEKPGPIRLETLLIIVQHAGVETRSGINSSFRAGGLKYRTAARQNKEKGRQT